MADRCTQIGIVLVVLAIVLVLDQASKYIVVETIEEGTVAYRGDGPTFFTFTHQRNTGLVNGAFSDKPIVALLAPFVALGVLIYLFKHLSPQSRLQTVAYGMVAGGALGNIVDRVFRRSVVDFLQFHFHFIPFDFPWKYYPAFNIADSAICVGVAILVFTWRTPAEHSTPHVSDPA